MARDEKPLPCPNANHCSELRCACHRLLACYRDGQLELSCPRCKRKVRIDLEALENQQGDAKTLTLD